jgi:hypothetical protein
MSEIKVSYRGNSPRQVLDAIIRYVIAGSGLQDSSYDYCLHQYKGWFRWREVAEIRLVEINGDKQQLLKFFIRNPADLQDMKPICAEVHAEFCKMYPDTKAEIIVELTPEQQIAAVNKKEQA